MVKEDRPKILVIDDDPIFCHTMRKVAQKERCEIITFSSPRAAYREFENQVFDVAIIDFNLGRVTGVQLSTHMKRFGTSQPIILISAMPIKPDSEFPSNIKRIENKKTGADQILLNALQALRAEKADAQVRGTK